MWAEHWSLCKRTKTWYSCVVCLEYLFKEIKRLRYVRGCHIDFTFKTGYSFSGPSNGFSQQLNFSTIWRTKSHIFITAPCKIVSAHISYLSHCLNFTRIATDYYSCWLHSLFYLKLENKWKLSFPYSFNKL